MGWRSAKLRWGRSVGGRSKADQYSSNSACSCCIESRMEAWEEEGIDIRRGGGRYPFLGDSKY